jgi:glucokinase
VTLTIGVDVGGTKVAGGVVDERGTVLASNRRETPAEDPAGTRDTIVEVAAELAAQYPEATAIGIGAAAWIDAAGSTVLFAPNLAWRDEPLRDYVAKAVGLPTVLENDANVAAWAEFRFGAGRDADDSMLMITVGTGIGGGIVLNGALWRGANGIAGELGHIQSVPDGHPCGCGRLGCLEQYASGNALVRFARAGARQEPDRAGLLLELAGGDPLAISGRQITQAAQHGDGVARDAFAQIGYWLGVAMADLAQTFDPQILVVGGGVIDAGELLMGPAERTYREQLAQRGRFPVSAIKAAETGNSAGVVGAADLARRI